MTVEQSTSRIVENIVELSQTGERIIVAIAGPPGAGKSTLAELLQGRLNIKVKKSKIIPMDGFHLDNAILEDRGLVSRKGAPQTFDAAGFVHLMQRLARGENEVAIPTFDRSRDISIAGADIVTSNDKILLVEGNYLLLDIEPWSQLKDVWDETIFINPGIDILEQRLNNRWLTHGLDAVSARERALGNDIPNAHHVLENSYPANTTIVD